MTDPVEDEAVFNYRCEQAWRQIGEIRADLAFTRLAEQAGEDSDAWWWRVWDRVEAIHPRDLALMVVQLLDAAATADGDRMWSQIHTMVPEDKR